MKFMIITVVIFLTMSYADSVPSQSPSEKYKEEMKEYVKQWKSKKPAVEEVDKESEVAETANFIEEMKKLQKPIVDIDKESEVAIVDDFIEEMKNLQQANVFEEAAEPGSKVTVESSSVDEYCEAISQGSTVALQLTNRHQYIGISGSYFYTTTCPGVYFDYSDWSSCTANNFQIYRMKGRGEVRVGDMVGLYHINSKGWIGCSGTYCIKDKCPGTPSLDHGFNSQDEWYRCIGAVFRIYANGKQIGQPITSGDDILIYYLQKGNYVYSSTYLYKGATCSGSDRPPVHSKYDKCQTSVFNIIKLVKK